MSQGGVSSPGIVVTNGKEITMSLILHLTDIHLLTFSKLSWSGIIFAIPAKKRCRYAPELDPTEAACHYMESTR